MKTNYIKVRPDRLNCPLVTCYVGLLSSAVFVIGGDVPDDIESMNVEIGRTPDETTTPPTARKNYSAACKKQTDGTWRCYLSPFHFPDLSEALEYHVIGVDANQNARWLGTGVLVVRDSPANGSSETPSVLPKDAYAYNPTTGRYHKITASVDEYGTISLDVDPEGVEK